MPRRRKMADAPPPPEPDPGCRKCAGAGWLRAEVPISDPNFGRPVRCSCCTIPEEVQREADKGQEHFWWIND